MNAPSRMSWFITGTDTGIGKTLISTALLHALGEQGLRAAGMKPVAAGTEWHDGAWHNEDSDALMASATVRLPAELVTPYLIHAPAAPHIAAAQEGITIDPARLLAAHAAIAQQADAVVVEGVGGFRVPLNDGFDSADLAQAFGLPVILVVGLRLGCINHALLSAEAIAARGLVLAGWIANCIDADMLYPQENVVALSARLSAPLLGVVPRLAQPSGAAACAHLDFTGLPGWPVRSDSHQHSNRSQRSLMSSQPVQQPVAFHPSIKIATPDASSTWPVDEVLALFDLPFNDLMYRAQQVHRAHFDASEVELATLLSIKTGGCEEDCGYCPQAARYDTGVDASKILPIDEVLLAAREAKANGATRFCMGAAWRSPKERDLEKVEEMVRSVKALGLETCATLGMLEEDQADRLKEAGLDYYNHNLDTAPEFYGNVISTREYQDRLDTLGRVRDAGLKVCCGGIVGMGESRLQRAGLIAQLANLNPYPESVPVNHLVQVEGTPLHGLDPLDPLEFVRTIAVARITMPKARVRLSAGRREMGEAVQALCFLAGANSIFYGDKLLTTDNPEATDDRVLLDKLGMRSRAAV